MKISISHQNFANWLKDQDVLTNPEKYLGHNWKDVLNFWIHLDTLSVEERRIINRRYLALDNMSTLKILACKAANDTIGIHYSNAAGCVSDGYDVWRATWELIGSHKLESLKFLPLFLNS